MIKRSLQATLRRTARQYPVVTLTGPRQSGKTTLVRAAFPRHDYASLEEPDVRSFALEDPRGFLAQFRRSVVLDEVQRTPDLFSYVQTMVDDDDRPGRFILTGSQNFVLLRSISQSLAGRCAILHLLPFSRGELKYREVDRFAYYYIGWNADKPLFADKRVRRAMTYELDREGIIDKVLHGLGVIQKGPYYHDHPANAPAIEP